MRRRLASISIDLDEVPRYAAIHGVPTPTGPEAHVVYERCVPRLASWLEEESIAATFFVVGEDLEREENRKTIASLHRGGHEIGNHSYHHHYDLTHRAAGEVREEVESGAAIIESVCGTRPFGFRAPGYIVSDALFDALEASGVEYDSSVFPCPSYYVAKALAIAAIRIRGRTSASFLDHPSVLRAPRHPYRIGRPYWRVGRGLLELPIGVTPWRLPYIGTSLVWGGPRVTEHLTKQMLGMELINLELHGFDAADAVQDGLDWLVPHRADLKRTATEKLRSLGTAIRIIRDAGYELVTLEEAARRFSSEPNR
ncbi:MAG: polysaccharide deacetylase family protein [Polyangiales bacterium]